MVKRSKKRANRLRNMVTICTLIAIVLSASTYAWFIGMRTVNVSSFDVEIAAVDGLALSLDGNTWGPTVSINADTFDTYEGNTNTWSGGGLIPMSSIGDMDSTASRMKLFEKASLTATPGGYRLMSSRVNNFQFYTVDPDDAGPLEIGDPKPEQDGYVAFDLFVKNLSGTQYIKDLNVLDEEAIYLTVDSEVNVAVGGVQNTGIENSVRVAFTQIGRVAGTVNTQSLITGITCTDDANVTGICRKAQIWEPNDKDHVVNAISWYSTSCKARTGADVTEAGSFGGACMPVIDGVTYPTYAVSKAIASSDNIDIYDGAEFNTYVNPSPTAPLVANPSFTDSDKQLRGTSRPTFMTLAPNSITKLRIYIYIEGQDVDNYDFASIGKAIAVKFGFTKERYTEDDIQYNGPDLNEGDGPSAGDLTVPVITLTGPNPLTLSNGEAYVEPGYAAHDNIDGDILEEDIVVTGTVNKDVAGTYTIVYKATDAAGNVGVKTRTVIVTQP